MFKPIILNNNLSTWIFRLAAVLETQSLNVFKIRLLYIIWLSIEIVIYKLYVYATNHVILVLIFFVASQLGKITLSEGINSSPLHSIHHSLNTFVKFVIPWITAHLRLSWHSTQLHRWVQYIPRNMHTVFALLCFVVVIHWLIFPYPSGLLH